MKQRSKRILVTLAIAIPLAVILLVIVFLGGKPLVRTLSINAICGRCNRLLAANHYDEVLELYQATADYPAVTEKMDQQLSDHAGVLLKDFHFQHVLSMCKAFRERESTCGIILEKIDTCAADLWAESYIDCAVFQQELAAEGFYVEALDRCIFDYICQNVEIQDYTDASTYFRLLAHNEQITAQMHAFLIKKMESYLQNSDWEAVTNMVSFLGYVDVELEPVSRAIYDHACRLTEQGLYEEAAQFFYILRDREDPFYYSDTCFMLLQLKMRNYLQEGKYTEAEALIAGYTGERREILQAIYQEYCSEKPD